jgi:FdhD protein
MKISKKPSTVGTKKVSIGRIVNKKTSVKKDLIVIEEAIELVINSKQKMVFLATPTEIKALAVGALYSLGLINRLQDIMTLKMPNKKRVEVKLKIKKPELALLPKKMLITSSKGASEILPVTILSKIKPVSKTLQIKAAFLTKMVKKLHAEQKIFAASGATHAALIFNARGKVLAFAEDLGRHNALDKAVGLCLLQRIDLSGCGVALSSRVSLEMLMKAARAGLELVAAVSAPTSLAIQMAKKWQITLCGFVRDARANVYSCPLRIRDM